MVAPVYEAEGRVSERLWSLLCPRPLSPGLDLALWTGMSEPVVVHGLQYSPLQLRLLLLHTIPLLFIDFR